jgi:Nitrate and nitrite sensing
MSGARPPCSLSSAAGHERRDELAVREIAAAPEPFRGGWYVLAFSAELPAGGADKVRRPRSRFPGMGRAPLVVTQCERHCHGCYSSFHQVQNIHSHSHPVAVTDRSLCVYLAQPAAQNKAAFIAQQAETDRAWQQLHGSIASNGLEDGGSQAERSAAATLSDSAGALSAMRHEITLRSLGRGQAENDYDAIIQAANNFLAQVIMADATETSVPLVTQGLAAIRMSESADLLQRETAMLIADMTAGSFPAADQQQFTELAGARREIFAGSLAELQPPYRTYYLQDVSPRALAALTSLENTVIATPRPSPRLVPAEKGQGAVPGLVRIQQPPPRPDPQLLQRVAEGIRRL